MNAKEIIEEAKRTGNSYHTLTFPDGTKLKGVWDMSKYLENYKIPDDLTGKTVLEIGPAAGYFSFEFARRGAKVVGLDYKRNLVREAANELMNTNVEFVTKDLFDLDESFGKFDIVFCSNVLIHVSDIFTALRKIKSVTKEKAIICTLVIKNSKYDEFPVAYFVGEEHEKERGGFWSYWRPNLKCFVKMMEAAGFSRVEEISTFMATSEDEKIKVFDGVVHGYV